jgi:farnesyl-diphosphate farnesyltransferase
MLREVLKSGTHPAEILHLIRLKKLMSSTMPGTVEINEHASPAEFSYAILNRVSRSFAAVIQELPASLKDSVCAFYLVLRGLDTIEDDTEFDAARKEFYLRNFSDICLQPGWKLEGVGDTADYKLLLKHFDKVIDFYDSLDRESRQVIADIADEMGNGMADFGENPVQSSRDFDLYCHYVAGLVGIGLTRLFAISGTEDPMLLHWVENANDMGLFLQKTNIIRDYREDTDLGRRFWPEEVWSKYTDHPDLFREELFSQGSVECLNDMITDALRHVPNCLSYLNKLQHPEVFRFCAIPQIMAIATLTECYDNRDVFRKNIKIRKGLTASIMLKTESMEDVNRWFGKFARIILSKTHPDDPAYRRTRRACLRILQITGPVRIEPILGLGIREKVFGLTSLF